MEEESAEETQVCDRKQERNVKAGKDAMDAVAKNSVEKKKISVGRETKINAAQKLIGFEEDKDPSQTADEKEMILVNTGVENKVGHVPEH